MKDVESLIGKLAHAAEMGLGRTPGENLSETHVRAQGSSKTCQRAVQVNSGFRSDVLWWATFLERDQHDGRADMVGGESSHLDRCIRELWLWSLGHGVRGMDPVGVESSR